MKIVLVFSASILITFNVMAANNKQMIDYKCFVETTVGNQIAFFNVEKVKVQHLQAKLPATKILTETGTAYVKDVHECVQLTEEFTQADAKKLDKMSVR
jgi:hypothetical protein